MNANELIQSILTYICTGGFVATVGYFAKLSKRLTILEERDRAINDQIALLHENDNVTELKLDKVSDALVGISTKLDLLLEGKLQVRNEK